MNSLVTVPEAIQELKQGNMLIVIDNQDREDQGDLIFPAQLANLDKVNFLLNHCRGMICVPMTTDHTTRLNLPLMVEPTANTETTGVQFTTTVDAKGVKDFGISSEDRVKTIQLLADPQAQASDFVRPGHVFPLLARPGGTLERDGHTEATIDLCQLAEFSPVGVLSEILDDQGRVMRLSQLQPFAQQHNLKILAIADLIQYIKDKKNS
jgi:3,4-dihydroxy 2-butanone 4-phosphate synthase/GTP cyclohydrolase II